MILENYMKKCFVAVAVFCTAVFSYAADPQVDSVASKEFSEKYDMLVSRLGAAGVGVETVLNGWAEVDPDNRKMLLARYSYYLTKGQKTTVVSRPGRKYLGNEPLFTLKDSSGADVRYFEETVYDDSLFAIALKNIDRAEALYPLDLDISFMKANALISYEKESPDMALVCLNEIIDRYYGDRTAGWRFDGGPADDEFFTGAVQEYCYLFFNIASPVSYRAFWQLSEKMSGLEPASTVFLSNIGSYFFVVEDNPKTALKYYRKVLKIDPEDYTAAKNCVLLCRRNDDIKGELRYLPSLIASTPDETERISAQARLDVLKKGKRK